MKWIISIVMTPHTFGGTLGGEFYGGPTESILYSQCFDFDSLKSKGWIFFKIYLFNTIQLMHSLLYNKYQKVYSDEWGIYLRIFST